jgi:hypothetical protein
MGPYVSSHPDGILFQTALCLVLSNNLHTLQTLLAKTQKIPVEDVSSYKLFEDLREQLTATKVFLTPKDVEASLQDRVPPSKSLLEYLQDLLKAGCKKHHRKSRRQTPDQPKAKHKRGTAGHFSIHRILHPLPPKKKKKPKAKDV